MSATYVVDVVHFFVAVRTVAVDIGSLLAIRSLGVTIAIDDFGTGFSTLSYLAKIPVDTLKIDRSFMVEMVAATGGLTLVPVIINLAHALRLNTVAEGGEEPRGIATAMAANCDCPRSDASCLRFKSTSVVQLRDDRGSMKPEG